jgi:hypothetical protein
MARHYSPKEFFRQMPNQLLARFFDLFILFSELDFKKMKETKPVELFEAWLSLPENDRNMLDAIQQEIYDLSCEKGYLAILDEARWQMGNEPDKLANFTEKLSALPNHYHRAMITFLDYSECWKGATRFYQTDTLKSYWRKRKNMGHNRAAVDKDSFSELENLMKAYFHNTEGRGSNCIVEVLRRGDLDYFFAYPEDFSQQSVEWVKGEFGRRPHNPAFQVVYIYSQKDGTLDLHFDGAYKAIEPLQRIFAAAILKLDKLPTNPKDSRIYDLNPLRDRNFNFSYAIDSGIIDVAVKKIRLSSRINPGDRFTFEADTSENRLAVYDQIEKIGRHLPLNLYNVTQVELAATIAVDIDTRPKKINIRLTYPNSCSLKYDDIGLKLRSMLEASGIEPKEPATDIILEPAYA